MVRSARVSATTVSRSASACRSGRCLRRSTSRRTTRSPGTWPRPAADQQDRNMSDVFDLACELISRTSVTPDDGGCQALIGGRLRSAGFAVESLRFGEVDNLWATHGDGGPVLVLLGHTDVVPPGPREAWTSDPFAPEVRDGLLFGRGAADMKGSVAAFVVALAMFLAR